MSTRILVHDLTVFTVEKTRNRELLNKYSNNQLSPIWQAQGEQSSCLGQLLATKIYFNATCFLCLDIPFPEETATQVDLIKDPIWKIDIIRIGNLKILKLRFLPNSWDSPT